MTLDRAYEQSNPSPQGTSTGWAEVPLLSHSLWHGSQTAGFSGHMPTTLQCPNHRAGVPSSSTPMFQLASSSLSSALSPSVSSSNPSPIHLQPDGAPPYLTGNCGSPSLNPGNSPMDVDHDNVNRDCHPTDPDRASTSTIFDMPLNPVGPHSPARFSVPPNPINGLPPANGSIPNNAHSHTNPPSVEACPTSVLAVSVPPMSSARDVATVHCGPVPSIPQTLVLEESTTPVPPSRSEPGTSAKSKRGKGGANYKLSSSLPVNFE